MQYSSIMSRYKLAERIEHVFEQYKLCHDLEVALSCLGILDSKEREAISSDSVLQARITIEDAQHKALVYGRIADMSKSADKDSVRYRATERLAEADYPEKFKKKIEVTGEMAFRVIPRKRIESNGSSTAVKTKGKRAK